jgi:D-lyxose ketol-isomerase
VKRSEINRLLTETKALLDDHQLSLPPFAYWTPADWASKGAECDEIRECQLGWDITDFGSGDFARIGLLLFTLRNGHRSIPAYATKTYCEKLLIAGEDQVTPMHYHVFKQEDIINRGGGRLVIELHNRDEDDGLADSDVTVVTDGVLRTVPAGTKLVLAPGESITLPPYLYHAFWAETGGGVVIAGEVSKVNDDSADNFFLDEVGRFPAIQEDCEPLHYLCNELPAAAG